MSHQVLYPWYRNDPATTPAAVVAKFVNRPEPQALGCVGTGVPGRKRWTGLGEAEALGACGALAVVAERPQESALLKKLVAGALRDRSSSPCSFAICA